MYADTHGHTHTHGHPLVFYANRRRPFNNTSSPRGRDCLQTYRFNGFLVFRMDPHLDPDWTGQADVAQGMAMIVRCALAKQRRIEFYSAVAPILRDPFKLHLDHGVGS